MDEDFKVSEDDLGFDDESEDMDSENVMVSIERELANSQYKEAGQNVEEDDPISLAANLNLLNDELHSVIKEVTDQQTSNASHCTFQEARKSDLDISHMQW